MYVIGKDEALRFVKENCTSHKERFIREIENGEQQSWLYRLKPEIEKAFVVEGVTELVEVYCFNEVTEERDANGKNIYYWEFGVVEPCIRHIETGVIGYPYECQDSKKHFGLSMKHEDIAQGMSTYFSYKDEQKPNYVGSGNKKKVNDWFGYITRENAARQKYIDEARARNAEFRAKVEKKYPNARIHIVSDGWMSECEFVVGYVLVKYEAGEDGRFYRSTKVDILSFPDTDKLFEEGEL